jgi:hypothetical protein
MVVGDGVGWGLQEVGDKGAISRRFVGMRLFERAARAHDLRGPGAFRPGCRWGAWQGKRPPSRKGPGGKWRKGCYRGASGCNRGFTGVAAGIDYDAPYEWRTIRLELHVAESGVFSAKWPEGAGGYFPLCLDDQKGSPTLNVGHHQKAGGRCQDSDWRRARSASKAVSPSPRQIISASALGSPFLLLAGHAAPDGRRVHPREASVFQLAGSTRYVSGSLYSLDRSAPGPRGAFRTGGLSGWPKWNSSAKPSFPSTWVLSNNPCSHIAEGLIRQTTEAGGGIYY